MPVTLYPSSASAYDLASYGLHSSACLPSECICFTGQTFAGPLLAPMLKVDMVMIRVAVPDDLEALLALVAGDSLAVAGSITPKVWTDREGQHRPALDMVAHQVLTTYHVTRKRRTVQAPHHGNERPALDDGEPLDF